MHCNKCGANDSEGLNGRGLIGTGICQHRCKRCNNMIWMHWVVMGCVIGVDEENMTDDGS